MREKDRESGELQSERERSSSEIKKLQDEEAQFQFRFGTVRS